MKRKANKSNIIYLVFFVTILFFVNLEKVDAVAPVGGADIETEIIPPANQQHKDKDLNYFEVKVSPGQTQNLQMKIHNRLNSSRVVTITPMTAISTNGGIGYSAGKNKKNFDPSLKYPFSKMSEKFKIKFKPDETKIVTVKVKTPKTHFNGVILGAINVTSNYVQKSNDNESTANIGNKMAYSTDVVIRQQTKKESPKFQLGKIDVGASQLPFVKFIIRNTAGTFFYNLKIKTSLTYLGIKKRKVSLNQENIGMAPNSNFEDQISWGHQQLRPGKYQLKILTTVGNKKQELVKNFTINRAQAQSVNQQNPNLKKDYTVYYILIGLFIILIIIGIFVWTFIAGKNRGKNKKSQNL